MSAETTITPVITGVKLTDVAATKVASLLAQEDRDDLVLRVAVQPGGCSVCVISSISMTAIKTAT